MTTASILQNNLLGEAAPPKSLVLEAKQNVPISFFYFPFIPPPPLQAAHTIFTSGVRQSNLPTGLALTGSEEVFRTPFLSPPALQAWSPSFQAAAPAAFSFVLPNLTLTGGEGLFQTQFTSPPPLQGWLPSQTPAAAPTSFPFTQLFARQTTIGVEFQLPPPLQAFAFPTARRSLAIFEQPWNQTAYQRDEFKLPPQLQSYIFTKEPAAPAAPSFPLIFQTWQAPSRMFATHFIPPPLLQNFGVNSPPAPPPAGPVSTWVPTWHAHRRRR